MERMAALAGWESLCENFAQHFTGVSYWDSREIGTV